MSNTKRKKSNSNHPFKEWLESQINFEKLTDSKCDMILDKVKNNPSKLYNLVHQLNTILS